MREIKFRGKIKNKKDLKRFNNYNDWIKGYYFKDDSTMIKFCKNGIKIKDNTKHYIINTPYEDEFVEIIPETIGQFTGLYDKNSTPIYEGDIVKSLINTFKIVFKKGCFFVVGINRQQEYTLFEEFEMCKKANINLEVIGNIYDNKIESDD